MSEKSHIPTVIAVCAMAMSAQAAAQQQLSSCESVYKDAFTNINTGQRVRLANAAAYSKHCSVTGQLNKQSFDLSVDATVEEIPFTAGINSGTSTQKMEAFCKEGYSQNGFYSNDLWKVSTISTEAQRNYNQCKRIENHHLIVTHQYTAPRTITFQGRYTDANTQASLDRVQFDPEVVRCSSTSFSKDGKPMNFNAKTPLIVAKNDFTIQCLRVATKYKDKDYYPPAQVILSLSKIGSDGIYDVSVPADDAYGPELSSDATAKIDQLMRENALLVADKKAALNDVDAWKQRLNNAGIVKVGTLNYASEDTPWPGPRISNDKVPITWWSSQCPAGSIPQLHTILHDIPFHDFGAFYYVGTCLVK